MKTKSKNARTRHTRYKVGTCKLTVTVENEDKVKLHRKAVRLDKKDDSEYLRVASMTFEERAAVAIASVISLVSQTMDTAKNRRKHCDDRAELISGTEEKFCFELIAAINQAGIDYDNAVARIKAWEKVSAKTIHATARGTSAARKGKAVQR